MRPGRSAWPLLLLLILLTPAWAQPVEASGASPTTAAAVPVKLGDSSTELSGPWKFHTGDDTAWANPSYDDSAWADMDLGPTAAHAGSGWSRRGYAGYSGFAWYRLQINVQGATHRLALKIPRNTDDAYQVYINGELVGELGQFQGSHVKAYPAISEAIPFPHDVGNGTVTIAIRTWMDTATRFNSPDAGGLHGPPVLGYASLINGLVDLDYYGLDHFFGSAFLEMLIVFMALLMAAALFWLDREEHAYLWLALVCTVTLIGNAMVLTVNYAAWLSQTSAVLLGDVLIAGPRFGLWVLFWGYWFHLKRIGRMHAAVWPLVGILILATAMLRSPLYGPVVPTHYTSILEPVRLIAKLALGALLFFITWRGFRTQKTEGWMAAVAVPLTFVANYQRELRLIHIRVAFSILDFNVSLGTIATVTSILIITVMLLRRFIQSQARKEQWKLEIEQAQQVQQVLIPHELPGIPGLAIDSDYRPAREVGGDFFQILPLNPPGTALIVVGDVTGKGVQAGMLVALIVGAMRAAVQHSHDPAVILAEINEQLCERQHAVATCLILRIDPDGSVTMANAGQLPPYLNGIEFEMEGAFPIGMVPEAEFSLAHLALAPNDSLFLMSDGVVEAQDADGTLFGFERVGEMLQAHVSSAYIADAAQQYGQEDDILVLQIHRDAADITSGPAHHQAVTAE